MFRLQQQDWTMVGLHSLDYLPAFAFLALVFAVGELLVAEVRKQNLLLGAIFLGFALLLMRAWLLLTERMHHLAPIFETTVPVVFFLGPMLRSFLQQRVVGDATDSRLLLHFIPGFLSVLLLLPGWLESPEAKLARIESIYRGEPHGHSVYLFPLGMLHIIIYMAWTFYDIYSNLSLETLKKEGVVRASLIFPVLVTVGSTIALVAVLSGQYHFLGVSITIVALNAPVVYFVQRRYPLFFHDLETIVQREKHKNRYQKSRLVGVNVEDLEKRLQSVMEEQEAFRDEDLSLPDLAARLDISAHQLSEYINHNLDLNFSRFVNRYRVDAACRILLAEPRRTVLSVAYDVGFNSKSTFNDAFARHTGMSPGQYRRKAANSANKGWQ